MLQYIMFCVRENSIRFDNIDSGVLIRRAHNTIPQMPKLYIQFALVTV